MPIATLADVRGREPQGGYRASGGGLPVSRYGGGNEDGAVVAPVPSLFSASASADRENPSGLPNISDMLCPRFSWKSVTVALTLIEIIMFIITLIVGATMYDGAVIKGNSMLGPSSLTLRGMGGKWTPYIHAGHVWRLITPIVLHAGFIHLFSNLFFQLRMGCSLELRWGPVKFFLMYLITGIGGCFWSAVLSPKSVSVGASGALFGLVGADIAYLYYNWRAIADGPSEACFLILIIFLNMMVGVGGEVDNFAHLGGLITGIFAGLALLPIVVPERQQSEKVYRGIGYFIWLGLFLLFGLLLWVGNPQ